MDTCPDCGSHQIEPRAYDGAIVHECALCGALGGDRAAVRAVLEARQAREHGVEPPVWPLVAILAALPGLHVCGSRAGHAGSRVLPSVQWQVVDARGLCQLENLGRSLQLARHSLQLPWRLELEFGPGLVFTLQPRPEGPIGSDLVARAQADLELLARAIDRDSRLSWWQRQPS